MYDSIKYHDNIMVHKTKWGAEYLAITFSQTERDWRPYEVSVCRYCVPGRCDTYNFDYVRGGNGFGPRLRYFSEGPLPLPKAIEMLQEDMNKEQVIELVKEACSKKELRYYAHQFTENLLATIAPKSKALRAARSCVKRIQEIARKEIEAKELIK